MGQRIWAVLEEYAGHWVALDKVGRVVDHARELPELTERADKTKTLTFIFAEKILRAQPPARTILEDWVSTRRG
ncbi:MAG: hypothetical protein HYZ74_00860 [Elusimicrobia bacterium]|nr:hypothetical protein [Elusimicrobiota bacterium]